MQPQQQNSKTVKKPEGTRSAKAVSAHAWCHIQQALKYKKTLSKQETGMLYGYYSVSRTYACFSMGIRAKEEHLLCSHDFIKEKGWILKKATEAAMLHIMAGQLIVYYHEINGKDADAHLYVARLEEVAIKTASSLV